MGEWFEKQPIGLLPERAARQWGAREALAFKGQRSTFAELSARVDAVAKGLLALGVAPGDKDNKHDAHLYRCAQAAKFLRLTQGGGLPHDPNHAG